jgi:hypothetical protein
MTSATLFLALVFAPAPIGLPVVDDQHHDWLHQIETTRNLELPRFISFFFIGLDYQVEHHLFPKIPHQNLPLAAKITREWSERNGVVHLSVPYLHALVDAAKFMARSYERDATAPLAVRAGLIEREPAPMKLAAATVDGTVGLGGHAVRLLDAVGPEGCLVALDREPHALKLAEERLRTSAGSWGWSTFPVRTHRTDFRHLAEALRELNVAQVDGVGEVCCRAVFEK